MIGIHCIAHQVALAASGAGKEIEKVSKHRQTVNNVFNYFDNSTVRYGRLRELNSMPDDK